MTPFQLKTIIAAYIFISCVTTTVSAKQATSFSPNPDSLNKLVENLGRKFISDKEHVGLSVGIIENGNEYIYNYGTIEKNRRKIPNSNTIYEIASITKSFTGIILAHAILEKRIRLNDDVHKYLTGRYTNLACQDVPIKIINLVNHTSGLPKFLPEFKQGASPYQLSLLFNGLTEKKFLESLSKVRIDARPGIRFAYSNADAQLIGIILERIYHVGYGTLLKRYITTPQHMSDTRLEITPSDTSRFAKGYGVNGALMPRLNWWRRVPAAGYIKSTVRDMMQYLKMNMNESDPAIAQAHQSTFSITEEGGDHIALFWFSKTAENGDRELYHAGGSFGTTTFCELCPDHHSGIVLLANDASPDTEHALKAMAAQIMTAIL